MNFHVDRLIIELQKRKGHNPRYSLRSFARDLKVTPSWLSEVMRGQKGMSPKSAVKIASVLKLRPRENEKFICSAEAVYSRSQRVRQLSSNKWPRVSNEPETKLVTPDELKKLSEWYILPMLDLLELSSFDSNIGWVAKRLGITKKQATVGFKKLIELGWLEVKNGQLKAKFSESDTSFDSPNDDLCRLHRQYLELASKALTNQSVKQREFLAMSMAFDSTRIAEVKNYIRDFQNAFTKKFYTKDGFKDSLYQLSIQWVRLDKEI